MAELIHLTPEEDAPECLARILAAEGKRDLRHTWVIFPGRRPFYYLNRHLAQLLNGAFLPPMEFTEDEFIEHLALSTGAIEGQRIETLDALSFLHQSLNELSGKGLLNPGDFQTFLRWGFRFINFFDELEEHLITVNAHALKNLEAQVLSFEDRIPRSIQSVLSQISLLMPRLRDRLLQARYYTRGMAYRAATEGIKSARPPDVKKIFWYIPYALSPSEEYILKQLWEGPPEIVVIYHEPGHLGVVKERPNVVSVLERLKGKSLPEAPVKTTPLRVYRAFSTHSEILTLREVLREEIDKNPARTAIVMLRTDVLPVLLSEVLEGVSVEYNITMGYPIAHFPPYSLIMAFIKVLETRQAGRFYIPALFNFLKHPYIKNLPLEKGGSFRAFVHALENVFIRKNLAFARPETLKDAGAKASSEINVEEQEALEIYQYLLGLLMHEKEQEDALAHTAETLERLFQFLLTKGEGKTHPFAEEFIGRVLDLFQRIRLSFMGNLPLRQEDRFFLLAHLLQSERVPFSGIPLAGLQVLGLLETRGIAFKNVYITDVNEGILPTAGEGGWLPPSIRKVLKLPLPEDTEKLQRFYFARLVNGADQVNIFYVDAPDKMRSPFVEEMILTRKLAGIEVKEKGVLFSTSTTSSPRESTAFKKTSAVLTALKNIQFHPTALDTYMKCPARFYFRYLLKLEEADTIEEDVEARDVGNIVHEALRTVFEPFVNKGFVTPEDIEKRRSVLPVIVREAMNREGLGPTDEDASAVREIIYHTLLQYLNRYLEIEKENAENKGIKIIALEKNIEVSFPLDANGNAVPVVGRVDRIDFFDGKVRIIDYKTGGSVDTPKRKGLKAPANREEAKHIIKSFQLPLYLYLGRCKEYFTDYNQADAGVILIKNVFKKPREVLKNVFSSSSKPSEIMENVFIPAMRLLIKEIIDESNPFIPDSSD